MALRRAVLLLALVLAASTIAACGSGIEGSYADSLGVSRYTFNSNGKMLMSTMGTEVELKYEVDGDKIKLQAPQGTLVLTLLKDGSIQGPMGMKLIRQDK